MKKENRKNSCPLRPSPTSRWNQSDTPGERSKVDPVAAESAKRFPGLHRIGRMVGQSEHRLHLHAIQAKSGQRTSLLQLLALQLLDEGIPSLVPNRSRLWHETSVCLPQLRHWRLGRNSHSDEKTLETRQVSSILRSHLPNFLKSLNVFKSSSL